ncbi:hypothetical protein AYI70_g3516, partial [Smittium culicis]
MKPDLSHPNNQKT